MITNLANLNFFSWTPNILQRSKFLETKRLNQTGPNFLRDLSWPPERFTDDRIIKNLLPTKFDCLGSKTIFKFTIYLCILFKAINRKNFVYYFLNFGELYSFKVNGNINFVLFFKIYNQKTSKYLKSCSLKCFIYNYSIKA